MREIRGQATEELNPLIVQLGGGELPRPVEHRVHTGGGHVIALPYQRREMLLLDAERFGLLDDHRSARRHLHAGEWEDPRQVAATPFQDLAGTGTAIHV